MIPTAQELGEYVRPVTIAHRRVDEEVQRLFDALRKDAPAVSEAFKRLAQACDDAVDSLDSLGSLMRDRDWIEGTVSE